MKRYFCVFPRSSHQISANTSCIMIITVIIYYHYDKFSLILVFSSPAGLLLFPHCGAQIKLLSWTVSHLLNRVLVDTSESICRTHCNGLAGDSAFVIVFDCSAAGEVDGLWIIFFFDLGLSELLYIYMYIDTHVSVCEWKSHYVGVRLSVVAPNPVMLMAIFREWKKDQRRHTD